MSGHSKWNTIKRKKAVQDTKRSNMFAKLLRAIEVAAREGGGSIQGNMTLASAVDKARDFSVPQENIERAIKRGTGEAPGAKYEEVTYEGFGPGGVAVLVEVLTDNRNRIGQEIRHAFQRQGGSLAGPGSTARIFTRRGVIVVEKAAAPEEDRLLEIVLEARAEDLADSESTWDITTEPGRLKAVRQSLESAGVEVASAEVTMVPATTVPLGGAQARAVLGMLESLEDMDDVQGVYANFDIPEDVLAEVG